MRAPTMGTQKLGIMAAGVAGAALCAVGAQRYLAYRRECNEARAACGPVQSPRPMSHVSHQVTMEA